MRITKLIAKNFKKFVDIEIPFNDKYNVIIGDNECGKSTILTAIDIVLSGSRTKIESLGLDTLINKNSIDSFWSKIDYQSLPTTTVELYFDDLPDNDFYGKNNSTGQETFGISLKCNPIDELSDEILKLLKSETYNFPFEYYNITFTKFGGNPYLGFKRDFRHILIDSSLINNEYATTNYINTLYNSSVTGIEKNGHFYHYRTYKQNYVEQVLSTLNSSVENQEYQFSLKSGSKHSLETDLTISEDGIDIKHHGKGRQCFIKTDFALRKSKSNLDFIMLEEPENHLSHTHTIRLIERIRKSTEKQLFIATHSSLITSRLDLRNTILIGNSMNFLQSLSGLTSETAKFFMKAPDNNLLEYILSKKAILVEGDSEYILLERFFLEITGKPPNHFGVHIISVDGTSFKRYLEVGKQLKIKTAVVRDNDGNYEENCKNNYTDYLSDFISVFAETDNNLSTFELSINDSNKQLCEKLFGPKLRSRSVVQYMLSEKTECAFVLLETKMGSIAIPDYIIDSVKWLIND